MRLSIIGIYIKIKIESVNLLKINICNDNYESQDYLIVFDKFGQRPNKVIIHEIFSGQLFEQIINGSNQNTLTELIPIDNEYVTNERVLVEITETIFCSYVIVDKQFKDYTINDVNFYYKNNDDIEKVNSIIDNICECVVDYKTESANKFNTLTISNNQLEIEPVYIDVDEIKTDDRYNSDLIKSINKLTKKIKKSAKGLTIFHGERGTGKTTMAKWMTSDIDRLIIYVPNNMIDVTINNPEFKNFLKRFEKVLLIIDDCELFTNNQFSKLNLFTNNINQLTEGFLSDSLNLHILLIFNGELDDIDDNITDSNSLIDIIEFTDLDIETSNELSKNLGFNKKYKSPVRLIDVLKNIKVERMEKIGL